MDEFKFNQRALDAFLYNLEYSLFDHEHKQILLEFFDSDAESDKRYGFKKFYNPYQDDFDRMTNGIIYSKVSEKTYSKFKKFIGIYDSINRTRIQ